MLRLRTFGGMTLERDGVRLDEIIAQRKVLALLAVLARAGDAGIGRERLMALLWAESDTERARGSLKQMLHTLRRQLGPDVVTGTSELHLNCQIVSSDVADFSTSIAAGDLEKALEFYRGPFLDGVYVERAPDFGRWQDGQRAELQRTYMDALAGLARKAEAEGRRADAVAWWLRCREADPLRASSVLALMGALDQAGDRAEALRYAQMHQDLLRTEISALPDPDVAALASELRASPAVNRVPQARPIESSPRADSDVRPSHVPLRSRPNRAQWFLASGAAIALLAAALIAGTRDRSNASLNSDGRRIVVAMFENQSGDSTLNSLQLLAADWMTREIAATPGVDMLFPGVLYIQGRKASGARTTALELARNNGAQIAIAGTYYRSSDTLFFAGNLIDVESGRVIRALGPFPTKVSTPLEGIEALRQSTSVALASMLDLRIHDFVSGTSALPRLDAYREFIAAEELHWRGDMKNALTHFARAGQLDSSFLLVSARMAITARVADRCDIVDSIAVANAASLTSPSDEQRPWILAAVAGCDGNMDEVVRLQRGIVAQHPRSPLGKWTLAGALRRANHPAEAAAILGTFDPEHDLGWLPDTRRYFFWRELINAQHATGDYTGEWKSADKFAHTPPGPIMSFYYKARSFAGRHDPVAAVSMVDSIESVPPESFEPADSSRIRPIRAATTGWTIYGMSEEMLAHGYPIEARALARRAVKWVEGRTDEERREPEYRLMLAQAHMMSGGYREAQTLLADLVRADSNNVAYIAALGRAAALSGDTATARRISASLVTKPGERGAGARILGRAEIALARGDRAGGMSILESLPYRLHPTDFLLLHSVAGLAPLHDQPRFIAFIRPKG